MKTFCLGELFFIARGGSPRPIEDYVTDDPSGLNWVKIGDATGGGKYIYKTKEKIRIEGLSKTRLVNPGDFLLTNSMSFGRPYIMATTGCIHDGWLVLKPKQRENIDQNYFYHLLSSNSVYVKFQARAGGSTVKNLNSDIVASVEIQIPCLSEQKRLSSILDKAETIYQKSKDTLALYQDLVIALRHQAFSGQL